MFDFIDTVWRDFTEKNTFLYAVQAELEALLGYLCPGFILREVVNNPGQHRFEERK